MGLGQHDEAQGAYCLRGDVHRGLPVERRQHCVLDVSKCTTGQLHRDRVKERNTDETEVRTQADVSFLFATPRPISQKQFVNTVYMVTLAASQFYHTVSRKSQMNLKVMQGCSILKPGAQVY